MSDARNREIVHGRFAATAALLAEFEEEHRATMAARVREFVAPRGDERALDAGAGTGALAFALAPIVREVVAVELVPECIREGMARAAAFPNVAFIAGDATRLAFPDASFDLAGCLRTLHHVDAPERVIAELARVTRPGGHVLIVDQMAPADRAEALALERFERARDPSHCRCLPDSELRALFMANRLAVTTARVREETRELQGYLDRAGCEGDARRAAAALAPGPAFPITIGWYLLTKPDRT
jgi:ubiquinone/menaquinone biosynthesis C-methylase UbiE